MQHKANDEEEVEKAQKDADRERRQELKDLRELLRLPAGQRYFRTLLESLHLFKTTFNKHSSLMALLEGERNVGLRILTDIAEADPEAVSGLIIKNQQAAQE